MDLPDNLHLEEKYQPILDDLIQHISEKRCCAFVGAGESKPAKYPLLDELLETLKGEAQTILGTVISDENIRNYDRAKEYKRILGSKKYHEIINHEFDPNNDRQPCLFSHLYLVDMPFLSYITTNYDLLIEQAYIDRGIVPTYCFYPTLPISKLRARQIFHIHGIIDHNDLVGTQESIILTSDDFDEAYSLESSLSRLMVSLYSEFSILFIGFNVTDESFINILQFCQTSLKGTQKIAHQRNSNVLSENVNHFALLPFILQKDNDELKRDNFARKIDYTLTNQEDEYLLKFGVNAIRYIPDETNHKDLINLLFEMKINVTRLERILPKQDTTFKWEI
jgi:hypothetical protein